MLFVVNELGDEVGWHTGESVPQMPNEDVCEIQADGHELSHVYSLLPLLSKSDKRVVQWFGHEAQFIYSAIKFFSERT